MSRPQTRTRQQPRVPGVTRIPVHSGLLPQIEARVRSDMRRFKVTRSFVIATALAEVYGIEEQPRLDAPETRTRRRNGRS